MINPAPLERRNWRGRERFLIWNDICFIKRGLFCVGPGHLIEGRCKKWWEELVKKEDRGFGIQPCGRPRLAKTINSC